MNDSFEVPTDRDASGRSLGAEELELLAEVIASGALNSNSGQMVRRFETAFADAVGARHCIACNSGSLAVQGTIAAADLPPGAKVVTSPITDFGAIAAILYENHRPVFCDVDPDTLMPTAASIERAIDASTGAVILTHLFGRPAAATEIRDLCRARGVPLLEDAAQALGAAQRGARPGTFGVLGAFSFQQSKQITCGEGGAIVTDDPAAARRARLFVNKAWPYGEPDPDHLFVAPNGRMTELQAAVLIAQLAKLDRLVERRRSSAAAFVKALAGCAGVRFPAIRDGDDCSFWRIGLVCSVPPSEIAGRLRRRGIGCQAHYVGRAAFELAALRDRGCAERIDDFPGVRDGLAASLVLPWNEGIDVALAARMGRAVVAAASQVAVK